MVREPTSRVVKLLWLIAVLLGILLLAVTNPSYEHHQQAIRDYVFRVNPDISIIGGGKLMASMTEYHSLGIASYTKFIDDGVATIGVIGYVWVK